MTKRSKFIILAILPVFFASYVQGADSQCNSLIYAVHDGETNNSQFLTINPLAGFKVAPLGPEYPGKNIEGLDIHPQTGELFGASGGDESEAAGHLYRVNKSDGALSDLGSIRFDYEGTMLSGRGISSLSFHPDGSLWGWSNECGLLQINEQTATAELKLLLTSPEVCRSGKLPKDAIQVEDLTWDNQGKVIYAAAGNEVWAYTYQTGELKQVARLPAARHIETLKMLPEGLLLVGVHGSASLKAINPETGVMVGDVNINTSPYNDVEGVAWLPCNVAINFDSTATEVGKDNPTSGETGKNIPASAKTIVITPENGGVITLENGFSLNVPIGAVNETITLWVHPIRTLIETLDESTGETVRKDALSYIYDLGPDGTHFVKPVIVQVPYNPDALEPNYPEERLVVLHDGVAVASSVDVENNLLTAQINHFSVVLASLENNDCGEEIATSTPVKYIEGDATSTPVKYIKYIDCTKHNPSFHIALVDRSLGERGYEMRLLGDKADDGTWKTHTVAEFAPKNGAAIVAINGIHWQLMVYILISM